MTINLFQFIRDGSLGAVHLGMTRAEVEAILGASDGETLRKNKSIPVMTCHGPLQFAYEVSSNRLIDIHVKTIGQDEIPDGLELEGYERIRKFTMLEFQELLASLGVGYTAVRAYMEPHQYDWLLDSGVQVIFDGESRMLDQMIIHK